MRLITILIATVIAWVSAAHAQTTQPTTRPTTYACLFGATGGIYPQSVTGLPALCQVNWNSVDGGLAFAKTVNGALFVDYENDPTTPAPQPGLAKGDFNAFLGAARYISNVDALVRRARASDPTKFVAVYCEVPIGRGQAYGQSQVPYVADNKYLAALGMFQSADAIAVGCYVSAEDYPYLTAHPEEWETYAERFVTAKVNAARIFGKRVIVFVRPQWSESARVKSQGDLPAGLFSAMCIAVAGDHADLCVWGERTPQQAKAYAGMVK